VADSDLLALALERLRDDGVLADVVGVRLARIDAVLKVVVTVPLVGPAATPPRVAGALAGLPHECVIADLPPRHPPRTLAVGQDGATWRIGTQPEVTWINDGIDVGRTIVAAVPARYDSFATVSIAEDAADRAADEALLVQTLVEHTADQAWWLGYLDTGAHDVVFDDAPKVIVYTGWSYVLVQAGPAQALTWRADDPWRGRLPELLFPADRSWLVSMLWDDDWRCLGGPRQLIEDVVRRLGPRARRLTASDDATPPGATAR
jgi:hypothetical protein